MMHIDWVWMTHPTRNKGNPIPVQIFKDGGVMFYRPFDEDATEFEMAEIDGDWAGAMQPQPAQPEQEPVACMAEVEGMTMVWPISDYDDATTYCDPNDKPTLLYAAPPARRHPLTDEEIAHAMGRVRGEYVASASETLWCSPHCVPMVPALDLFTEPAQATKHQK